MPSNPDSQQLIVRITNPHRKKQIQEFTDDNRPVLSRYYDVLEHNLSPLQLETKMRQLIKKDPDFYEPYIAIADMYVDQGMEEEARTLVYQGFCRAMKRIVDSQGRFPQNIPWGWLENRHMVRIIYQQAYECWVVGDTESALYLLRNLLRSNPNDNIGARYDILAIRLKLDTDYEYRFATPDISGYMDAFKVHKWFEKESKKFPDEFDWWWKIVEPEE